jgi:hypothetical protein
MSQIAGVFCVLVLLGSPLRPKAEPTPASAVMVRLYSEVQLPGKTLAQAEQEAVRIFHQAGIEAIWVQCETFKAATDPRCYLAPGGKRLVMRIVDKGSSAGDSVFGMAFLSETDGHGAYSDVFFGSVEKLHGECGASMGRVLGHVMAHELGHLLLGSKAHAVTGIMRPHWYGEQLSAISKGALFFTPEEAILMRKRLVST